MKGPIEPGVHFTNGNFACAEGAIMAGCRFYAGYPITPSSEILEKLSERLPEVGGHFIEMEDEIGSMAAIVGASNAGLKSMTATSGPGYSLMQENLGLGMITETPCVVVNEMRVGPSTGIPTRVGQGDVMQVHWGTHGDVEPIAYSPNSVQEMFDLTVKAFNAAELYRQPVIMLPDQVIGHLSEKIVVKPAEKYEILHRVTLTEKEGAGKVFEFDRDYPSMLLPGMGIRGNVDSLTHDESGYPSNDAEVQDRMMRHILGKVRDNRKKIVEFERLGTEDAETVVIAYGIMSRVVEHVVKEERKKGNKIGMLRPITIWPFPEEEIIRLGKKIDRFVVAELNYGQYSHPVREYSPAEVDELYFPPGRVPSPEHVLEAIKNPGNPYVGTGRGAN